MPADFEKLYALVKRIPKGRVLTYGELAKAIRLPGGARAAGRAMAACPSGRGIPWHRVLGAGGRILIREGYAGAQRRLLQSEGTWVVEGRVNLAEHSWKVARQKRKSSAKRSRRKLRRQPNPVNFAGICYR